MHNWRIPACTLDPVTGRFCAQDESARNAGETPGCGTADGAARRTRGTRTGSPQVPAGRGCRHPACGAPAEREASAAVAWPVRTRNAGIRVRTLRTGSLAPRPALCRAAAARAAGCPMRSYVHGRTAVSPVGTTKMTSSSRQPCTLVTYLPPPRQPELGRAIIGAGTRPAQVVQVEQRISFAPLLEQVGDLLGHRALARPVDPGEQDALSSARIHQPTVGRRRGILLRPAGLMAAAADVGWSHRPSDQRWSMAWPLTTLASLASVIAGPLSATAPAAATSRRSRSFCWGFARGRGSRPATPSRPASVAWRWPGAGVEAAAEDAVEERSRVSASRYASGHIAGIADRLNAAPGCG